MSEDNIEVGVETSQERLYSETFGRCMRSIGCTWMVKEFERRNFLIRRLANVTDDPHVGVDGETNIIFLPLGFNINEVSPTLVEEGVHVAQMNINGTFRSMAAEVSKLIKATTVYRYLEDTELMSALVLTDTGEIEKITDHVRQKADFIGLTYDMNFAGWFELFLRAGAGPGFFLRFYRDLQGEDEQYLTVRKLLSEYYDSLRRTGLKYNSESSSARRNIFNSVDYERVEDEVNDAVKKMSVSELKVWLKNSGYDFLVEAAELEAIINGADRLDETSAKKAIERILDHDPELIDLEVLAHHLGARTIREGFMYTPKFGVMEQGRLSKEEIIANIRAELQKPERYTGTFRYAVKEYLVFRERTEMGTPMLRVANGLRYDDYPEDLQPTSPFLQEGYQSDVAEMMDQFEESRWKSAVSASKHRTPLIGEDAVRIYEGSAIREAEVAKLKTEMLRKQGNFEYQNTAIGIEDAWEYLSPIYDLMLLESPDLTVERSAKEIRTQLQLRMRMTVLAAEVNLMGEPIAKLLSQKWPMEGQQKT